MTKPTSTSNQDMKPVTNGELRRAFRWQDTMMVLSIFGALLAAYIHLDNKALAQVDAGMKPLSKEVEDQAHRLNRHQLEVDILHVDVKEQLAEIQKDNRALYKAVMTGRPQARLEHGSDGGAP